MSDLRRRWTSSRRFRGGVLFVIALLVVVVTWQPSPTPGVGFDPSWQIGLHLAAQRGLDFGDEIVFPYGPLGFLLFPRLVAGGTWALALVATLALRVALVAAVIAAAHRASGRLLPAAAVGYLCAAALGSLVAIPGLLAALIALILIQTPLRPARAPWLVEPLLGALGALAMLMKLDGGVVATVVLAVAALSQGRPRWRSLARYLLGYVVVFVVGWLSTGNDLRDVPRWIGWSTQVVGGYTEGAVLSDAHLGAAWHYVVFGLCVAAVAVLAGIAWAHRPTAERAALSLVLLGALWVEFKHGFVRHDTHAAEALLACGVMPLALRWRDRRWSMPAFAVAAVGIVGALGAMNVDAWQRVAPSGLGAFGREARMLVAPERRDMTIERLRVRARRNLEIDPSIIDAIGTTPVHVAPDETAAVWAFDLRWRPEPQFQAFSTWSAGLDRLNAARLASERGPHLVLRENVARLDRHNPIWESPRENLTLICDFRRRRFIGRWELLERIPSRCGPERVIALVSPDASGLVSVPRGGPDTIVSARIVASVGMWERARTLLFRPGRRPRIRVIGAPVREPYRVPAPLLAGPLILRVPPRVALPPKLRAAVDHDRIELIDLPGARLEFVERTLIGAASRPDGRRNSG